MSSHAGQFLSELDIAPGEVGASIERVRPGPALSGQSSESANRVTPPGLISNRLPATRTSWARSPSIRAESMQPMSAPNRLMPSPAISTGDGSPATWSDPSMEAPAPAAGSPDWRTLRR